VIDAIVPEPDGGAHTNHEEAARLLAASVQSALAEIEGGNPPARRAERHRKFRSMGVFLE
jgi:acetyl-CoA carboxylase alpha subunit